MASVKESWSGRAYELTKDGYKGRRLFTVTEVDDEDAAIEAVRADVNGAEIGLKHPRCPDSTVVCDGLAIDGTPGPDFYPVKATYASPALNPPSSSMGEPATYSWTPTSRTIETDTDALGSPMLNSLGKPYEPKCPKDVHGWRLVVRKYELFFDPAIADAYQNHLNSTALQVGSLAPAARQMLCELIAPTSAIGFTQTIVMVQYAFAIETWDAFPFDTHRLNMGRTAWWNDGGTKKEAPLFMSNGTGQVPTPVTWDVPISNLGVPINTAYQPGIPIATPLLYELKTAVVPAATPVDINSTTPPCYVALSDSISTVRAYKTVWPKFRTANFAAFGLF